MKKLISCIFTILLASCQNKPVTKFDKLEKMNWLIGHWEEKVSDGTLIENWKKENDSTYNGESYFINTKDTVHFEYIQLQQREEELTYSATVIGQNGDKPILFLLTSDARNVFTFENPEHDYPQKIEYKKATKDLLIATISGKQQGKESKESYPLKRK